MNFAETEMDSVQFGGRDLNGNLFLNQRKMITIQVQNYIMGLRTFMHSLGSNMAFNQVLLANFYNRDMSESSEMPDQNHALSRLPDNDFSVMELRGFGHFFCHI